MADPGTCVDCAEENGQEVLVHHGHQPEAAQVSEDKPKHDPLDASTFVPPTVPPTPSITIEFCDRCRWLHRATWVSTELFLTFPPPALHSTTLVPHNAEETAGRFRVWLLLPAQAPLLVWDRKLEGGFPELKVLKQRIRDHLQPGKSLGHSDKGAH